MSSKRQSILDRVNTLLSGISTDNGFNTNPITVRYGDGTPSEYDQGVELFYLMPARSPVAVNKRWDWEATLQVTATIYGDRTPATECQVEADILKALGSDQSLSGPMRFLRPDGGDPHTTEIAVAGKAVTLLTLNLGLKYQTNQWES